MTFVPYDCAGATVYRDEPDDPYRVWYELRSYEMNGDCTVTEYNSDGSIRHYVMLSDIDEDEQWALERARIWCCCTAKNIVVIQRTQMEFDGDVEDEILKEFTFDEDEKMVVEV